MHGPYKDSLKVIIVFIVKKEVLETWFNPHVPYLASFQWSSIKWVHLGMRRHSADGITPSQAGFLVWLSRRPFHFKAASLHSATLYSSTDVGWGRVPEKQRVPWRCFPWVIEEGALAGKPRRSEGSRREQRKETTLWLVGGLASAWAHREPWGVHGAPLSPLRQGPCTPSYQFIVDLGRPWLDPPRHFWGGSLGRVRVTLWESMWLWAGSTLRALRSRVWGRGSEVVGP